MALYLRYAVRSDLGLVRNNNEDSVYAGPRLLAIADGMGGHAAGEVASKIVIATMEHLDEDRRIDDLMGALRDTVARANQGIADATARQSELEGMGTTLTALRFVGGQIGLVHVGDSRAYMLRNEVLTQITHDDTYVQYLVDNGKLTPEEAKDHPRKSVILKALLGTEVEPDVSIREAKHGDRYMLCSDGLSDVVSTETIFDTLRIADVQESADRLVELALRGGGPDNVTVIVADVINARVGDVIDDVPVIAGAFVDPAAADVPGSDSAAERAAQMARPKPAQANAAPARRRRFNWRPWLLVLAVLIVLSAALGGTYAWTQTKFFVSADGTGGEVAIFRGVNTEFGPLKFFTVYRNTDLAISDLNESVRSQVRGGIAADTENDAERIIVNLRANLLPKCADVSDVPSPSPSPSLSPSPSPSTLPRGTTTGAKSPETKSPAKTPAKNPRSTTGQAANPAPASPRTSLLTAPTSEIAPRLPFGSSLSSPQGKNCRP
ncbi:MAG: PP2C family serine/threonine-protein phosphatase [Jatrophihabitans sp.]